MGYEEGEGLKIEKLRFQGAELGAKSARLKSTTEIVKSGSGLLQSIIFSVFGLGLLYFLLGGVVLKVFNAINIWLFLGIIFVLILLWKWR